jgi:predicted 3-demethylubiquinone-9 3-methyltransferase (glyoxalase superfamily)
VEFYERSIPGVSVGKAVRITEPSDPRVGDVRRAEFMIGDSPFIAVYGGLSHEFTFRPAVSIWLDLDSEAELEEGVKKLSTDGATHMRPGDYGFSRRFAWVDDRFGVAWQLNLFVYNFRLIFAPTACPDRDRPRRRLAGRRESDRSRARRELH